MKDIHTDIKRDDRYVIIIDGQWYRYTTDLEAAWKYAVLNSGSIIFDLHTGRKVGGHI